jgi:hypothetical protein
VSIPLAPGIRETPAAVLTSQTPEDASHLQPAVNIATINRRKILNGDGFELCPVDYLAPADKFSVSSQEPSYSDNSFLNRPDTRMFYNRLRM